MNNLLYLGKTRGAKRKAPKEDSNWVPGGAKQKRGYVKLLLTSSKISPPNVVINLYLKKVIIFFLCVEYLSVSKIVTLTIWCLGIFKG